MATFVLYGGPIHNASSTWNVLVEEGRVCDAIICTGKLIMEANKSTNQYIHGQIEVNLSGETMERFLSDMSREKPTKFSSQELAECTRNFSQFSQLDIRNHDSSLSGESREWVPRWAYDKFKKDELVQIVSVFGIDQEERERVERMVKVALWCVQYLPSSRPMMSSVVKMFKGGVEIDPPPNPFAHLENNLDFNGGGSGCGEASDLNSFPSNTTNESLKLN